MQSCDGQLLQSCTFGFFIAGCIHIVKHIIGDDAKHLLSIGAISDEMGHGIKLVVGVLMLGCVLYAMISQSNVPDAVANTPHCELDQIRAMSPSPTRPYSRRRKFFRGVTFHGKFRPHKFFCDRVWAHFPAASGKLAVATDGGRLGDSQSSTRCPNTPVSESPRKDVELVNARDDALVEQQQAAPAVSEWSGADVDLSDFLFTLEPDDIQYEFCSHARKADAIPLWSPPDVQSNPMACFHHFWGGYLVDPYLWHEPVYGTNTLPALTDSQYQRADVGQCRSLGDETKQNVCSDVRRVGNCGDDTKQSVRADVRQCGSLGDKTKQNSAKNKWRKKLAD